MRVGLAPRSGCVLGESCGSEEPSSCATGCENVRRIAAVGEISVPGAGLATITGERDGGNQVTATGALSFSQGRTAAAISIVPGPSRTPSETVRTALTGVWWTAR